MERPPFRLFLQVTILSLFDIISTKFLNSLCSVAGATTVTVSSNSATPLTSLSTVPISMLHQQLLLQSGAGGVRQLFFPVNFGNRSGAPPRYIQVRQVTMGGQQGVLSLPRFGTPITMRTITHPAVNVTQTGPQQVQPAPEQVVAPVKPATVVSTGDTHIVLSSEVPDAAQVSFQFLCISLSFCGGKNNKEEINQWWKINKISIFMPIF